MGLIISKHSRGGLAVKVFGSSGRFLFGTLTVFASKTTVCSHVVLAAHTTFHST